VTLSIQSAAAIAWQCIIAPKRQILPLARATQAEKFAGGAKFPEKKRLHRERFRPPRI
jgi:hypothetical protein